MEHYSYQQEPMRNLEVSNKNLENRCNYHFLDASTDVTQVQACQ